MRELEFLTAISRMLHDDEHISAHQPSRPSWQCAACRTPWPCALRKRELSAEFTNRLDLAFYLLAWLHDAIRDHPDRAGELTGRYITDLRSIRPARA